MMNETTTQILEKVSVTLESAETVIDFWQQRVESAETETAALRERVAERDAELTMLREALDTIPLHEYGEAQREGCDAKGAWDCFKEALTEHVAAVRSVTAVYDAKTCAEDLHHQLATVTALVPEADLIQQASQMMWHTCESCPTLHVNCPGYEDDRTNGLCTVLARQLVRLAAALRDWREEQGQEDD